MNKKLLWTLALPAVLASCSQDDLISEGITNNTPQGKAISGVTFTIAKNGSDANADTRAEWVDNKISFEKGDLVSLFFLGEDGYTQNDGFDPEVSMTPFDLSSPNALTPATALIGYQNAVFRTEDGSNFTAEAVVYEGYNLLVYPGNTKHVTEDVIEVSLPEEQDASEDFTKNVIYVGDSILHIHEPALAKDKKTFYDMYNAKTTEDAANTSGYAHGIKTGVKLLSSLLDMNLRIINTKATDVKIQKVELTTTTGNGIFANEGNLIAQAGIVTVEAAMPVATQYRDPWFLSSAKVDKVVLNCEDIETNQAGTQVTMLLLPADATTVTTDQPVLKVYTNYGVVTIGGSATGNNNQSRCIFVEDGVTPAAETDNEALQEIVTYTSGYDVTVNVPAKRGENPKDAKYTFTSGVYMNRYINVDMSTAKIEDPHVKNTAELNTILNAAINSTATNVVPLTIYLDYDAKGNFELTNYEGLEAFIAKFETGDLTLASGVCTTTPNSGVTALKNINVNTTEATALKAIEGLPNTITLTIPATSKINAIANGTSSARNVIVNPIINESVITVPNWASITLQNNKKGTVHYTPGTNIKVDALTSTTYGTIDYVASSNANLNSALENGANYVTVADINTGFFDGGIDATASEVKAAKKGGVTIVFDNCGDLSKTISFSTNEIKAETIVLTDGTTYSDVKNATVKNIIVESETAVLGYKGAKATDMKGGFANIQIKTGTTTINNLDLTGATLQVDADATANVGTATVAPDNFYVFGTATFAGSNRYKDGVFDYDEKDRLMIVDKIDGNCLVTGSLELAKDLAYKQVAVSETTKITVAKGVIGLGFSDRVYVTKDEQATGTANLKYDERTPMSASRKSSWTGVFSNLGW